MRSPAAKRGRGRRPAGRRFTVGLALAGLVLLSSGCAERQTSTRPQVGVTLLTEAHVFYQDLKSGLEGAADSLGLDLHIVAGEWDLARQTAQVQNFITRGVDAILIAPVNSTGIVSAVEEANAAGIPVFTVDIAAGGGEVVSHIASDNRQGGRLLADYLARRLGGRGSIAILDQPTVTSVRDRVAGFREGLADHPGIEIVAAPAVERGLRDVAKSKTDNLLAGRRGLDAIFGTNDDCALGALAAVQAAGREEILIVGYDATPEARSAIAGGTALVADAVQHPTVLGRRAAEIIARHLDGGSVPERVSVPVSLVTRDSLRAEAAVAPGTDPAAAR